MKVGMDVGVGDGILGRLGLELVGVGGGVGRMDLGNVVHELLLGGERREAGAAAEVGYGVGVSEEHVGGQKEGKCRGLGGLLRRILRVLVRKIRRRLHRLQRRGSLVKVGGIARGELLERGSNFGLAGTRREVIIGHLDGVEESDGRGHGNGDGDEDDFGSRTIQWRAVWGKGGRWITARLRQALYLQRHCMQMHSKKKSKRPIFLLQNLNKTNLKLTASSALLRSRRLLDRREHVALKNVSQLD